MVNSCDLVICKKHGHLFELFKKFSLEPIETMSSFIQSDEQLEFDKLSIIATSQDEMYSFDTFIIGREFEKYDYLPFEEDKLFFIGYLTQYIGYNEKTPVAHLFSKEDIKWLWDNFDVLHTQDVLYVWGLIKEHHS